MADNDPNNDENTFIFAGKRMVFAGMLIVLGLLVYIMVKDIQKLPHGNTSRVASAPANAAREVAVGFRVSGRINQMFFAEHAEVKQGDILASLDKVPFEEALAAAKAQLQVAQAEYNKSSHLPTSNFNAIEAARATVETAQHTYDTAHAELEKRRSIMVAGQMDNVYDDDVQNERDAELNLERTRRELAQQEDAAGNRPDRAANQAAVQAAQANVVIAETNLADTQLLAPAAGIIASRSGEIGATMPAGATVYTLSVPKTAAPNP